MKPCGAKLADGQWWAFCGETDMGQGSPVLCEVCDVVNGLKRKESDMKRISRYQYNQSVEHQVSFYGSLQDCECDVLRERLAQVAALIVDARFALDNPMMDGSATFRAKENLKHAQKIIRGVEDEEN